MRKPEKGDRHLSSRATTHKLLRKNAPETGESMTEVLERLLHAKGEQPGLRGETRASIAVSREQATV